MVRPVRVQEVSLSIGSSLRAEGHLTFWMGVLRSAVYSLELLRVVKMRDDRTVSRIVEIIVVVLMKYGGFLVVVGRQRSSLTPV